MVFCACNVGFVTSFLVNPIERIKILMQSDKDGQYKSEIDCAIKVIKEDGLKGLLVRGLDATLAREIPGYGLYFVVYSLLMTSVVGITLGPNFSPLVCGAAAGCLSWIPVFPFDVVKTYVHTGSKTDFIISGPETFCIVLLAPHLFIMFLIFTLGLENSLNLNNFSLTEICRTHKELVIADFQLKGRKIYGTLQ